MRGFLAWFSVKGFMVFGYDIEVEHRGQYIVVIMTLPPLKQGVSRSFMGASYHHPKRVVGRACPPYGVA